MLTASIEFGSSSEEIEAVKAVLDEFGIEGNVMANRLHFSEVALPWTLILEVYAISKFLDAFISAAGTDAWKLLRSFLERLADARRVSGRDDGFIRIEEGGTLIQLSVDLPDEAYRGLVNMKPIRGNWYVWDSSRGEWQEIDPRA